MSKYEEKEKAIGLRKQGKSYKEILDEIGVAKSTLSLWLRSVNLSKEQKRRLTQKSIDAAKRGAKRKKEKRVEITREIKEKAAKEIKSISKKELWLMGIMLYWAEGSKEKSKSSQVEFMNSDPAMIRLFIKWLLEIVKVREEDLIFEIYIHENHKDRLKIVRKYWSESLVLPVAYFQTIRFKKHKVKTIRKNIGDKYFGIIKLKVRKSTNLNRRIAGWAEGIDSYYQELDN